MLENDIAKARSFKCGCVKICQVIRYLIPAIAFYLFVSWLLHVMKGEDRTFEKQRLDIAEKIDRIVVGKKICPGNTSCRGRNVFFVSPYPDGISIQTYGINSTEALGEIANLAVEEFMSNRGMNIILSAYSISKEEEMKSFISFVDPFYKIEFKREGN